MVHKHIWRTSKLNPTNKYSKFISSYFCSSDRISLQDISPSNCSSVLSSKVIINHVEYDIILIMKIIHATTP